MQRISSVRQVSQGFLWLVPFFPLGKLAYRPGELWLYAIAGATQACLMAVAAWILASNSFKKSATGHRALLVPGILLVMCWASASLALKMGLPPRDPATWAATHADQGMRYVALLVAGLLAWSAFGLIAARLGEAGERTFSVLGLSAATIATAIFSMFTLGALTVYHMHATQVTNSGHVPEWWPPLNAFFVSCSALFSVLTYLAASLYAVALANAGFQGRFGRVLFVVVGTIAAIVAIGATVFHRQVVVLAPAVAFIPHYFLGVNLIRRAGDHAS